MTVSVKELNPFAQFKSPEIDTLDARASEHRRLEMAQMPTRFETSSEDPWLNGVIIRAAAESMRADAIEQVLVPAPGVV